MCSKETETFQKSMKLYNLTQSIMMLIVNIALFSILMDVFLTDSLSNDRIHFNVMISSFVALFIITIYTWVQYIRYLIVLKAIRFSDPNDLFSKAYKTEITILMIMIGSIIAYHIVFIGLMYGLSSDFSFYIEFYISSLFPILIIIFLALLSRSYLEVIAILLGYLANSIHNLPFFKQIYGSEYLPYVLPEILLLIIFLCMSISIVIFQFKLDRIYILIKQSIGIQTDPVKIREKEPIFDKFHWLEFCFHFFAGITFWYLFYLGEVRGGIEYPIRNLYIIPFVMYLSTTVIMFFRVKNWTNMMTMDRNSLVMTPTTTTSPQISENPSNEPFTPFETANKNVIDQSPPFVIWCSRCGFKITDKDAKFCPICGEQIV